jgi:hypothetical protein
MASITRTAKVVLWLIGAIAVLGLALVMVLFWYYRPTFEWG